MNGSDFFIGTVSIGFMYIVAFICGLAGKTKTPGGQAEGMRLRRNASDEEAHRPRKAKSGLGINSVLKSNAY
ncbi:hypothetical protein ASE51_17890 [Bacillus sp. Root147]|jgi:hypothetical protein|nr:hypothetical protein ASE51_17890 [Bacillus sp. Root147]